MLSNGRLGQLGQLLRILLFNVRSRSLGSFYDVPLLVKRAQILHCTARVFDKALHDMITRVIVALPCYIPFP